MKIRHALMLSILCHAGRVFEDRGSEAPRQPPGRTRRCRGSAHARTRRSGRARNARGANKNPVVARMVRRPWRPDYGEISGGHLGSRWTGRSKWSRC